MQPNETPAIARYNANVTYNGTNWIPQELHNTLGGTVTITGTDDVSIASTGLFIENKTQILFRCFKSSGVSRVEELYVTTFTANQITLGESYIAPASGDMIFIQIEVFNLAELN